MFQTCGPRSGHSSTLVFSLLLICIGGTWSQISLVRGGDASPSTIASNPSSSVKLAVNNQTSDTALPSHKRMTSPVALQLSEFDANNVSLVQANTRLTEVEPGPPQPPT
eukprot:CAMPEP_0114268780 /NCGR_PEP_ID=MMETSP0058-20121206/26189_1 /TAXON_ID=36894 /ORGANISM="Pyramimonas parkeae, CCMP726" /LENGTH=108 /DNA_ID=CAMNT_0001387077 /DNA_START=233 /DNA_END=555 /DNA_ORIENTATION=-